MAEMCEEGVESVGCEKDTWTELGRQLNNFHDVREGTCRSWTLVDHLSKLATSAIVMGKYAAHGKAKEEYEQPLFERKRRLQHIVCFHGWEVCFVRHLRLLAGTAAGESCYYGEQKMQKICRLSLSSRDEAAYMLAFVWRLFWR